MSASDSQSVHSAVYNFFFHPMAEKHSIGTTAASIASIALLSIFTLGVYLVAFVSRQIIDYREYKHLESQPLLPAAARILGEPKKTAEVQSHEPSSTEIAESAAVDLPNYRTVHINENGEVFYLTPMGAGSIDQYGDLNSYTKACIEINLGQFYEDPYLSSFKQSVAEKVDELQATNHTVKLWIQACHFIVVKSNRGRYWFLHYDPSQAKFQSNKMEGGYVYPRPNYSDLRPILPYSLKDVALDEDETVQVLVVHPSQGYHIDASDNLTNGEFDAVAFKKFVGKDRVASIQTICSWDFIPEKGIIDIVFDTANDRLTLSQAQKNCHMLCFSF